MLGCDKEVTVTHLSYDGDADRYVSTVQMFKGCSWYSQLKCTASAGGLLGASVYRCRIPATSLNGEPAIAAGDKITCGSVSATVLAVHDNRRGQCPHIYVEAS